MLGWILIKVFEDVIVYSFYKISLVGERNPINKICFSENKTQKKYFLHAIFIFYIF